MWTITEIALFVGCGVLAILTICFALVSAAKNNDTQRRG